MLFSSLLLMTAIRSAASQADSDAAFLNWADPAAPGNGYEAIVQLLVAEPGTPCYLVEEGGARGFVVGPALFGCGEGGACDFPRQVCLSPPEQRSDEDDECGPVPPECQAAIVEVYEERTGATYNPVSQGPSQTKPAPGTLGGTPTDPSGYRAGYGWGAEGPVLVPSDLFPSVAGHDASDMCCMWASQGECQRNRQFMCPVCQASCLTRGCTASTFLRYPVRTRPGCDHPLDGASPQGAIAGGYGAQQPLPRPPLPPQGPPKFAGYYQKTIPSCCNETEEEGVSPEVPASNYGGLRPSQAQWPSNGVPQFPQAPLGQANSYRSPPISAPAAFPAFNPSPAATGYAQPQQAPTGYGQAPEPQRPVQPQLPNAQAQPSPINYAAPPPPAQAPPSNYAQPDPFAPPIPEIDLATTAEPPAVADELDGYRLLDLSSLAAQAKRTKGTENEVAEEKRTFIEILLKSAEGESYRIRLPGK